jgi:hypothetical protein
VPDARDAFEFIEFVTAMIKPNGFYLDNLVSIVQLVGDQLVVEFPYPKEVSQKGAVSDPHRRALRKLRVVRALRFSHDNRLKNKFMISRKSVDLKRCFTFPITTLPKTLELP